MTTEHPPAHHDVQRSRRGELSGEQRAELDPVEHLRVLGHALDFCADDLLANRRGRMSSSQRRRRFLSSPLLILFFSTVFISILAGAVVHDGGVSVRTGVMAGAASAMPILTYFIVVADAIAGTVGWTDAVVSTATELTGSRDDQVTTYYVVANGTKYRVTEEALSAVVSGRGYRLYVTAWWDRLLSLEPLPDLPHTSSQGKSPGRTTPPATMMVAILAFSVVICGVAFLLAYAAGPTHVPSSSPSAGAWKAPPTPAPSPPPHPRRP